MTHIELLNRYKWRPIPHCPGRYTLRTDDYSDFKDFYGTLVEVKEHSAPHTKDTVLVYELEDGGIVSYRKEDGYLVHTLCNKEGFDRILEKLGI